MDQAIGPPTSSPTRALMELFDKLSKERGREYAVRSLSGRMQIEVFGADQITSHGGPFLVVPLPCLVRGQRVESFEDFVHLEMAQAVRPREVQELP